MEKQITKENLKRVFVGYRHFDGKTEKELNNLGFTIKRKRKHIILLLIYNENLYTFTISVSASDNRCGHKIVSTIMNTINKENFYRML